MRRRAFMFLVVMTGTLGSAWAVSLARSGESDGPGGGLPPRAADWSAIKKVIAEQRSALKSGNAAKAFSFATPAIRDQFGDAAAFIDMVRALYSALLTARYVEFLDGAVVDGAVIQPLRLIDADHTVRVALYIMERQPHGTWRISGCRIAASALQAT
jgi:Domain of unknown function (DUF4864)